LPESSSVQISDRRILKFVETTLFSRMPKSESTNERFDRGWEKLKEIDGEAGQRVIDALKEVAPDLARYTIEFPFGDVYSRGVLSLKEREIATVAALAALGHAQAQLKVHVHGALNVGCIRKEVVEVIIQIAVYAGFPAAINAALSAKEVFQERDAKGLEN
jgi:4-carboxymuconolactone decarboxylase